MVHQIASLDSEQQALLPVLRHLLVALQGSDALSWRVAFQIAVERWGEGRGLALAHRAEVFLSAVLAARIVPFTLSDPMCLEDRRIVTEDEANILRLLSAMRSESTPKARDLLFDLTNGRPTAASVQAGLALATLLEGGQTAVIRRPAAPLLRAVS